MKQGDTVRLISWTEYKKIGKSSNFEGAWFELFYRLGWSKAVVSKTYEESRLVEITFKRFWIFRVIMKVPEKLLKKVK